ncbi:MAG: beta-ketoacyl-ACP synthase II [Verrucomicrobiales bacterium]
MSSERRVVITGMGIISPLGNDPGTFWDNLARGRSGVRRITRLDPTPYPCQIAGESTFEPREFFNDPKDARRADRYAQLAMAGAKLAVKDGGLAGSALDPTRVGVMVGSGIGGLGTFEEQHTTLLQKNPARLSPFTIPMLISNIASGMISMDLGFLGPNMAIVTACATSNHNIGEAWRIIKFGDADAMLAGGAEASILPMGLAGFANMRALSTRNDEPEKASRPFDKDRDGFVMGEGAGVVILEELAHAKRRGARIYCELVGYGISADAHHLSAPDPEGKGAAAAMAMALKHAALNPDQLQYVNAHATSTGLGDVCETKALKRVFGNHCKNGLLISSTKSMTGHLLGAAGGIEIAATVLAMQNHLAPPTINLDSPDPECDLDYVPNVAREVRITAAMSNSFGFGGHNATVVIKRFDG